MQTVPFPQLLNSFWQYCLVWLLAGSSGLLQGAVPAPGPYARSGATLSGSLTRQTTCPTINRNLSGVGDLICNAQDVAPENLRATITLTETQVGISYQIWGYKGATRSSFSAKIPGNGGNLVFTITPYYQGEPLPLRIPFDVIAYDCKGNQDTLQWQPRVVLNDPVAPPSVNEVTISSGQTATLKINIDGPQPAPVTYAWYAAPGGGSPLAENSIFTTPPLTATTTYYAVRREGVCESQRVPVTVTVKGAFVRRLNAGGSGYTTTGGKVFGADASFTGGSVSAVTTGEVANTADDALYRNARYGTFSYGLASGNGLFDVVLHFNETWFGNRAAGGAGSRRFHVDIEGVRRLTDYDIFAKAGGAMRATTETIRVAVNDGTLNLNFVRGLADNPMVAAVEVLAVRQPPYAFRVNAGSYGFSTVDGRFFEADRYFSGGTAETIYYWDIAGTADDFLYQSGRSGAAFAYNLPTGNGYCDVVLHFAETYYGSVAAGGAGSRQFHVDMEGTRKLTNYDVFAKAGGAKRARQEVFRVQVTDGTLNVNFLKGAAGDPAVKAIEVLPAGSALAINAGGGDFTTATGKVFAADVYYAHGSLSGVPDGEVANTADDALYRSARTGTAFSYGLPSGNGTFDVTLHFAENYFGYRSGGGIGSRRFNVDIEGVRRLTDYDIFAAAGGAMRAVKRTLRVTVADGILNLYFSRGSASNPSVSAIEVAAVTGARLAGASAGENGAENLRVLVYPNPVSDKLTVRLPFPARQVTGTAVVTATGESLVQQGHHVRGEYELEIPVAHLGAGLHLLRLDSEHGRQVVRFVKAH
jgi:hypothetical protein